MRTSGASSQCFPPRRPSSGALAGVFRPLPRWLPGALPTAPLEAVAVFSSRFAWRASTSCLAAKGSGLNSQSRCAGAADFSARSSDQYGRIVGGSVSASGRWEQNCGQLVLQGGGRGRGVCG